MSPALSETLPPSNSTPATAPLPTPPVYETKTLADPPVPPIQPATPTAASFTTTLPHPLPLQSDPVPNGTSTNSKTSTTTAPRDTSNIHSPTGSIPNTYPPLHPPTLTQKVALITGASRGIGAGIALELASRGAAVVVNYHKGHAQAAAVVAQITEEGGEAVAIQADVSDVAEIGRLFEESVKWKGKVDIVCSNSGMESFEHVGDVTPERFDAVFGLNLRAQFFVGQAAYKYCTPGGRLVLMSSIAAGLITVGDHALYSGSKAAINGITKSFAQDFGRKGITVNAIAPGGVKSDMFEQVAWRYLPGGEKGWGRERVEGMMAGGCPLGRCAVPEDVARVVAFLVGEDGGWVNGQVITISGGSGQ